MTERLVDQGDDPSGAVAATPQRPHGSIDRGTLTVTGSATVSSAPDKAVLTLAVESDGTEPGASMNANATAVRRLLARLETEGVEASSIETAHVNVYPVRAYNPASGEETLTGYRSENTVSVTLRGEGMAEAAGRLLSAALEVGATSVSGPVWALTDACAATEEALKQAAANARKKAEALAETLGVKVGDVLVMSEGLAEHASPRGYGGMALARMSAEKLVDTPISAVNLEMTGTVTVTYTLDR